jgi:hypothetical protein
MWGEGNEGEGGEIIFVWYYYGGYAFKIK